MSLASKLTFALCCATSLGIIGYVHYKQEYDRKQLHLGVERDIERQERRKAEKLFNQPINFTDKLPTSEEQEQLQAS
ncbi:cytochrome c oxidase assembly factor-like [Megachile rotundata]|uniref:cytochrome c oxidase assembly factor-like n=1 Tax=Megachile rotundata TaxID=143995 RepID=UPI000258D78C|nr:PREDICTED: protein PET117 homolog, mitochondrial [Megachile rotundata]